MFTHAQQTRVGCHAMIALTDVIGFKSVLHTAPSRRRYVPPLASDLAIADRMRDLKNIMTHSEARTKGRVSQC